VAYLVRDSGLCRWNGKEPVDRVFVLVLFLFLEAETELAPSERF
jgi:hypothetical protein